MIFLKPKFKTQNLSGVLTCCFCGVLCCDTHEDNQYHSNNADCEDENDRCCLKCNDEIVLTHRMMSMFGRS